MSTIVQLSLAAGCTVIAGAAAFFAAPMIAGGLGTIGALGVASTGTTISTLSGLHSQVHRSPRSEEERSHQAVPE